MLNMKLVPRLSYLVSYKYSTLSYSIFAGFPLFNMVVDIGVFKLLNILLYDLVDSNIKDLYVASTPT